VEIQPEVGGGKILTACNTAWKLASVLVTTRNNYLCIAWSDKCSASQVTTANQRKPRNAIANLPLLFLCEHGDVRVIAKQQSGHLKSFPRCDANKAGRSGE